eukprot:CAMPEP_0174728154 /NCGR_PEP_ID=MMETSP1094-20130205/51196_1 /TAXON_ID=156173 /ORGANISM="Chrysochromulina brevifilum, Strain UTEX LB 985" /LENGTH=191 /DNA_ID=CAMNT_0015930021 /DNA_START=70 /DNA_END=645 /DNA_ORIENTATION=+
MGGSKHISEGKSAIYGKQPVSDAQSLQVWRNRMHNENTGMPTHDNTGTNASVSMMWQPSPPIGNYMMTSHKRHSELKRVQDFGVGCGVAPRPPPAAAGEPSRPAISAADAAVTAQRDALAGGFLDTEGGRLQAAAHARNLGQTFLLAGNLRQAKAYLERAEKLMQVDKEFYASAKAKKALDEMQDKKLHPY